MLIDCQCYVLHIDLIQGYVNWSVLSGYKFLFSFIIKFMKHVMVLTLMKSNIFTSTPSVFPIQTILV